MASLDIRPHSPQLSVWVVAGLMLLGAGSFAAGVFHQLAPASQLPLPPPQQASLQVADATPALDEPLPVEAPKHRAVPPADAAPHLDLAQAAPGADASATAAPSPAPEATAPQLQTPQAATPGDTDPPT